MKTKNETIKKSSEPCQECSSTKQGREKVYQDFKDKKTGKIKEIHTSYLYYCKNCVDKETELSKYWEKLAKELKCPDIVYWQLSYCRSGDCFCLEVDTDETWLNRFYSKKEVLEILNSQEENALRDWVATQLRIMVKEKLNQK